MEIKRWQRKKFCHFSAFTIHKYEQSCYNNINKKDKPTK
nr:MAG TPA: hypothetical protein [Caudoviricetes sp.]